MKKFFLLCILIFFISGCGGLSLGAALLANTGGTIAGNAAWHKIKEKYPEEFPDTIEKLSDSEKQEFLDKMSEMNDKYLKLIEEIENQKEF